MVQPQVLQGLGEPGQGDEQLVAGPELPGLEKAWGVLVKGQTQAMRSCASS